MCNSNGISDGKYVRSLFVILTSILTFFDKLTNLRYIQCNLLHVSNYFVTGTINLTNGFLSPLKGGN
jgi:hypothetical protein